jgi:hypothetical protein
MTAQATKRYKLAPSAVDFPSQKAYSICMIKTEVTVWYGVFCDECGAQGPYAGSEEKATQKAKDQGWLVLEETGKHFCPEHTKTDKAIRADLANMKEQLDILKRRNEERFPDSPPIDEDEE